MAGVSRATTARRQSAGRTRARSAIAGIVLGALAFWLALPPLDAAHAGPADRASASSRSRAGVWSWSRDEHRLGWGAVVVGHLRASPSASLATRSRHAHLDTVVVWRALLAATLRFATPLIFAAIGGMFSERSGVVNIGLEGMMLMGAFFGIWGARQVDRGYAWVVGLLIAMPRPGWRSRSSTPSSRSTCRPTRSSAGTAVNFLALGITGYLFIHIYGDHRDARERPRLRHPGRDHLRTSSRARYFIGRDRAAEPDDLALVRAARRRLVDRHFKTPIGLRSARSASIRARPTPSGISVYRDPLRRRSSPPGCWSRPWAAPTSRSASCTRSTRT